MALDSISGTGARSAEAQGGEEIWIVPWPGGEPRRRVSAEDLAASGHGAPGYSLHDLSWSSDGSRLAFTWYDGSGWARVLVSDEGRAPLPLPSPLRKDDWEPGISLRLSASQLTWSADGRSGVVVAWDEACGSLYSVAVPASGAALNGEPPAEIAIPGGCRPLLLEADGLWLYRSRESGGAQRLGILNAAGSVIESRLQRVDSPVFARWGRIEGPERPPIALWWREPAGSQVVMAVWRPDGLAIWTRATCGSSCPEPIGLTRHGLWILDGGGRGRLTLIPGVGRDAVEMVPAGVAALQASKDGEHLVVIMDDPAGHGASLWRLTPGN